MTGRRSGGEVGAAVRDERERQGLSRRELAERAGLSYPYIAQIESGDRQPSNKALTSIADALGLRASDLLAAYEEGFPPPPGSARAVAAAKVRPDHLAAAEPMRRWVPASAAASAAPTTRPAGRDARQQLAELTLLAARLEPEDVGILLDLARRLAR